MRKNQTTTQSADFKIIAVDDEQGILDSLSIFMKRSGYSFVGITDPMEAINRVKNEHFDLMVLDFIMSPDWTLPSKSPPDVTLSIATVSRIMTLPVSVS